MSHGQSSITRQGSEPIPATVTGANNGVSLSGLNVVLGNDVGGTLAQLISNREIPFNGFSLAFTAIGSAPAVNIIIRSDAARLVTTPQIVFQNSAGAENARIIVNTNLVSNDGDTYFGYLSGSSVTSGAVRDNTAFGYRTLSLVTTADACNAFGAFALGKNTTGRQANAFGLNALANQTTAQGNTAIGHGAGFQITTGGNNVWVGTSTNAPYTSSTNNVNIGAAAGLSTGSGAFTCNGTIIIGALAHQTNSSYGDNNVIVGYNINNSGKPITTGNVLLGANITTTAGALPISNLTVIGQGIACNIPNVAVLGRADQNIILGTTVSPADNGNRLQVLGRMTTGGAAPLTAGAGAMDFGKVVAAASVLNAAQYLEMVVDGVLVKVCIN